MPAVSSVSSLSRGDDDYWLSVHEASAMLGVSLSTLRRWADAGKIPIHRTLGGHRRFSHQELQALVTGHSAPSKLPNASASSQTSWNGDQQQAIDQQEWHRKVSERPVAERMRGLGQRLLGLLIQHVHSRTQENRFLTEAETVGTTYGKEAFDASISLQDTVKAFLYFRRTCSQLTSPADGIAYPVDLVEAAKLQEQIDAFMDAVLLGALSGYESQQLLQSGEDTSVATGEDRRQ
jgi:excisionase family DNA binding protein